MEVEEKVRIFVGGLGAAVTSDELRRVFELAGGAVHTLDFVRTKDRSFAYVDFLPSSPKSLSNLFAKYNGCVWKGAKLRLEKAKDHYLIRLRREWAQAQAETEAEAEAEAEADSHSSELPSLRNQKEKEKENTHLRIFFPSLRKVKSLPFSGTGKHKYSFQRPNYVPPLPMYFCDCEEHSGPCTEKEKHKQVTHVESLGQTRSEEGGGINEEELNIMNKVMTTLLLQNQQNHHHDEIGQDQDDDEDEDNLIINVATTNQSNHKVPSLALETQQLHPRNDREPPKKKKKLLSNHKATDFESGKVVEVQSPELKSGKHKPSAHVSWSQKSSWRELVAHKDSNSFSISEKLPNIASTEEGQPNSHTSPKVPDSDNKNENDNLERGGEFEDKTKIEQLVEEAQPEADQNVVSTQTGRGASWRHKSSWTQLISETSSFSISQVFSGITSEQQVPTKNKDADAANSAANANLNEIANSAKEDGPSDSGVRKEGEESRRTPEENQHTMLGNNEPSTLMLEETHSVARKQISPVKVAISDTCSFMRSATSLKEWAKTKATLSASLKRKGAPK